MENRILLSDFKMTDWIWKFVLSDRNNQAENNRVSETNKVILLHLYPSLCLSVSLSLSFSLHM